MHRFLLPVVAFWSAACPAGGDFDGDGFFTPEDCNDADVSAYPGAEEVPYDLVDQDCDGSDLTDVDEDGVDSVFAGGTDCDDENPDVFPDAEEIPYDGLDNNCDGSNDDDFDQDGYEATERGGTDCNDFDAEIVPLDTDGDGFSPCTGDCDETDKNRNPLTVPICGNDIDDNCDGVSDCALTGEVLIDTAPVRIDGADGKGLGVAFGAAVAAPGDVVGEKAADLLIAGYTDDRRAEGRVSWFQGPFAATTTVSESVGSITVPGVDLHMTADDDVTAIAYEVVGESGLERGVVGVFIGPPAGAVGFDTASLQIRNSVVLAVDPVSREETRSDQRMGDALALLDGGSRIAIGAKEDGCVVLTRPDEDEGDACGTVNLLSTSLTGDILYGSEGALIRGAPGQRVGQGLHAFDHDGDGVDDLIIGSDGFSQFAPTDASIVHDPPQSGVHLISDLLEARVDLQRWGDLVGGAASGDLDGDGLDDLVIGAPRFSGRTGGVAVFTRPLSGTVDPSSAEILRFALGQDGFGQEVMVHDLDGDGAQDLIVGAPAALGAGGEGEPGAVHVWYGPLEAGSELSLQSDLTLLGLGGKERTLAGAALAFEDIDDDGFGDLVAASPGEGAGVVYVFYGGATALGGI